MMKKRNRLIPKKLMTALGLAAAAEMAFLAAPAANATPLSALSGDLTIKYSNFETAVNGPEDVLSGIFNVTSIGGTLGTNVWTPGTNNHYLVGYFDHLQVSSFTSPTEVNFTGGHLVLYMITASSNPFDPTANAGSVDPASQLCGGACPQPYLTANYVPGIFDAVGDTTTTLASDSTGTNPPTGHGTGYLSVASVDGMTGYANAQYDTNGFSFVNSPNADLFLNSDFKVCTPDIGGTCDNGWPVVSQDPVKVNKTTVAEPGVMALMGLALIGLVVVRRRVGREG